MPNQTFVKEVLQSIRKAEQDVTVVRDEIERAEKAGVDVSAQRAALARDLEKIARIKQAYKLAD